MSYQAYSNLTSPNEVLVKIAEYVTSRGYSIVKNAVDDLNIYDMSSTDGKKLVFKSRNGEYFYILRSANGTNIFGVADESDMDNAPVDKNYTYNGIGVIISEGYSNTVRWYNQGMIPKRYKDTKALGLFMPVAVKDDSGKALNYTYTLFCNNVSSQDADTLVFTVMKENDSYRQCAHIVLGTVSKYADWTGGAFFSASATSSMIGSSWECFEHKKDADNCILPVLSSGDESNTFLRIDIDDAPSDTRGNVYWASSGTDNVTGKKLSLPIRTGDGKNGKIPNYWVLQSHDRLDWGRNVNTLNCLSINLPIYMAISRDPESLSVYSTAGYVEGVYFINTLNMQTSFTYKLNYPSNTDICQVFPQGKRRGVRGYDGISIRQEDVTSGGNSGTSSTTNSYSIMDTTTMQTLVDPSTTIPIMNINNSLTNISAYGGDSKFKDPKMTMSTILLSQPYTNFNSLVINYTEDTGDSIHTVQWTKSEFANAMSSGETFDLLKGDSTEEKGHRILFWRINPRTSSTTILSCKSQNCGIVSIIGNLN